MKNGKKLTRKQKEILADRKLNPNDFLVVKDTSTEIQFWDRVAKNVLVLKKGGE